MIAVTFALPPESSAFVRRLRKENRDRKPQSTRVVHTGVGARECERRLGAFLAHELPRTLISSGFCGGTNDDLAPGDLVIGANCSDAELAVKARQVLPNASIGNIFSATRVLDLVEDRYRIGREHGAIAIDMETETIAQMCAAKKIPMLSLRVVSDSPAARFPAPPEVLFDVAAQRTKFSRLLPHLAGNPAAVARVVRFSRQISTARRKLADGLCDVLGAL
ncbi:MAG: hypothetical protein JO354_13490 [Verrucomicrobia bacterium]|nr:hypothetical protein [Verrucomicrobiota bacterium]